MKKNRLLLLLSACVAIASSAAHAQTIVTFVGITTANQQPGSANDFIDFYSGDYPTNGPSVNQSTTANGTVAADLNSFTINGGVRAQDSGGDNFSTIMTPMGGSLSTGILLAEPGIAFALTPGVSDGNGGYTLNPNFNYNDFNVYLMFSNTNGLFTDGVISVDPRGGSTSAPFFGSNDQAVTDNTNATPGASPSTAQYIEFHITGLGTAIAASPGADLVVSANLPNDGQPFESYIGGVSFTSNAAAPEPSTYAMLLAGGLGLLVLVRRNRGSLNA